MALVIRDRVKETSTTTGTGTITLTGAYDGYRTFASCVSTGSVVYYCIHNTAVGYVGEWEVGYGTFTLSGTTLSRTAVYSSSNAGSLVSFSAGTKEVFITQPADQAVYQETDGTVAISVTGSSGSCTGNATTATSATTVSSIGTTQVTTLYSPNGATVVGPDTTSAMPAQGQSFIHTLGTGPSANDGHLLSMTWAGTTTVYGAQVFIDTDPTNTMAFRSRSSAGVWNAWDTVLHSTNYNSYSPTLTGGGASGSWGISVTGSSGSCTGNAATATSATTATTANATAATLTRGSYLTGSNFNGSSATTWAVDADSANTASKVVARDASGNFSAGTITASLTGNCSGSSGSCTGNAATATSATSATTFTSTTQNSQFTSIGVGTAASGTSGEIRATNNITAYYSDDRLKTRLGVIDNALDRVGRLTGFFYEANELAQRFGYEVKREVGLSAQDVEKVLPEVVAPAPIDDQYLTLRYERIVPLLIEAIKELRAEVDALKGR